jgi:peroxiredoxin
MNPKRLITSILARSAQVIAMQAENPKDFTVESPTHGTTFTLSEAKGRIVALHFLLKTECPFCLKHTHDYSTQAASMPGIIHVFLKPDSDEEIKKWAAHLDKNQLKELPVIYRDPDANLAEAFGIPNGYRFHGQTVHFPALVVLDGTGKELFRYVGKSNADRMSVTEFHTRLAALLPGAAASAESSDPRESLPAHITRLTWFGERADWRHDGQRFVFLNRAYGDVYEYELATQRITPCSDHFKHFGFLRALYLSNGDLLLSGPRDNCDRISKEDRQRARDSSHLYVLDKSFTKPPVPLGVQCNEGPAVSRKHLRIAWTHGEQDHISTGDIVYESGVPRLVNSRLVLRSVDLPAGERPREWIETQNFIPPDETKLTITAYEINDTENTDTFVLDLVGGALTNMTRTPD